MFLNIREIIMTSISDENLQLVTGQIVIGQAVLIAYDLGIFKLLSVVPLSIQNIADDLKIKERSAQAIISCCCAMGLIESKDGTIYQLSKIGEMFLNKKSITYYGGVFDLLIRQNEIMNFEIVKKSVLTNSPQVSEGTDIFSNSVGLGGTHDFVRAIHQKGIAPAFHWTKLLELEAYSQFIDIGGGSGIHTIAACLNNPSLRGIVCDRQPVLFHTQEYVKKFNLEKRITLQKLDMWEDQFPAGDVYFLSDIFHDWNKEKCISLAKKCFKSLPQDGLIVLHEMLFNENKTGPFLSAAYNMKMMLWTEGQQFNHSEIQEILHEAGFQSVKILKSLGNWSLVVGQKK